MQKRCLMVLALSFLVLSLVAAQQPGEVSYHDESVMPGGKIGERIRSLIETFNSGDPAKLEQFIQNECTGRFKTMPMEQHRSAFQNMFRQTGGLDFHSIRTYDPPRENETIVILKDRNFEAWRAFILRFNKDKDYLITSLGFNDARVPSNVTESPLSEKDFLKEVETLVRRLIEKEILSGAVLVAKGDKVLFMQAAGEASKRFHVANNIDTKFNLGSMNKMFTSVAIMKLVEEGRLSLDHTLDKFVDESWLPQETTSKIMIRHLLTHSSGLGSYFNQVYARSSRQLFRNLDDYKSLVEVEKLAFEPGTRFQYSNTGMFLLGVVIEKVTGENYFDYIRKVIYEPAGMKNSDCYDMDYPVENLAIGYSPDPDSQWGWQNNYYKHVIRGGPAGGGFSTVGDLHRFALALLSETFVSKASLEKMWTDPYSSNYGFGFSVRQEAGGKVVGHGGGFSGINSNLDIFLDSGYIVAVMSNIDMGASPLARRISALHARLDR